MSDLSTWSWLAPVAVMGLVVAALTPPSAVSAQLPPPPPSINVAGDGEARAEPDLAIVTVGATHVAPTSQEAMDEVSRRVADVIAGARALGLQDRDIQTTGLSLQPIFRPRPRGDDSPPEIEAYRASNNVTLTVRQISQASVVLDAAVRAGANVVGGLRFGLSNVEELRLQALQLAVANARGKANAIAFAAGVSITGVLSISEEGVSVPRPVAEGRALDAAVAAPAPPVEPGELIVRARVRASFTI